MSDHLDSSHGDACGAIADDDASVSIAPARRRLGPAQTPKRRSRDGVDPETASSGTPMADPLQPLMRKQHSLGDVGDRDYQSGGTLDAYQLTGTSASSGQRS